MKAETKTVITLTDKEMKTLYDAKTILEDILLKYCRSNSKIINCYNSEITTNEKLWDAQTVLNNLTMTWNDDEETRKISIDTIAGQCYTIIRKRGKEDESIHSRLRIRQGAGGKRWYALRPLGH